jgi:hypothetical protein
MHIALNNIVGFVVDGRKNCLLFGSILAVAL